MTYVVKDTHKAPDNKKSRLQEMRDVKMVLIEHLLPRTNTVSDSEERTILSVDFEELSYL